MLLWRRLTDCKGRGFFFFFFFSFFFFKGRKEERKRLNIQSVPQETGAIQRKETEEMLYLESCMEIYIYIYLGTNRNQKKNVP
jgi:hypothetical protein